MAVLVTALFLLGAPRALAAGTFDKNTVAANTDVNVTLHASVDQLGAYDDRVVLDIPAGFRVLTCPSSDDFSCTKSTTTLTWKRTTQGAPVPLAVDDFAFRLHTIDRPGQYAFVVHQFYSDNTTANSAPKLSVTSAAARPTTTTTLAKSAAAVHTASVAPPPARAGSASVSGSTDVEPPWLTESNLAAPAPIELGRESPRRGSAPMVVAGLIAAAAAAGVFWLRRRAAPTL
ncbi:MAG: hypothetical protein QOG90_851 [Actinomycetota bacterium]|jgi:hypothetical protein